MFPTGLGERKDSFVNKDTDLCTVRYNRKVSGNVCRLIAGVDVLNRALSFAKLTRSRWKGKNCMRFGRRLSSKRLCLTLRHAVLHIDWQGKAVRRLSLS